MVVSIRQWVGRVLFVFIFVGLLIVVSGGYRWLVDVVSPVHPYHKPQGDAVKVIVVDPTSPEVGNTADRLRWFYWSGE